MGASKTNSYSSRHNQLAMLLKALAHPARIAIVEHLLQVQTCICGEIVDQLPLSQPTVSQHLRELKTAGIIVGRVEGNSICYCLNKQLVQTLRDYFHHASELLDIQCCPSN